MVYVGKDSAEKFVSFLTKLIGLLKRKQKAVEKCHVYFKKFAHAELQGDNDSENRQVRDHRHYTVYTEEQPKTIAT